MIRLFFTSSSSMSTDSVNDGLYFEDEVTFVKKNGNKIITCPENEADAIIVARPIAISVDPSSHYNGSVKQYRVNLYGHPAVFDTTYEAKVIHTDGHPSEKLGAMIQRLPRNNGVYGSEPSIYWIPLGSKFGASEYVTLPDLARYVNACDTNKNPSTVVVNFYNTPSQLFENDFNDQTVECEVYIQDRHGLTIHADPFAQLSYGNYKPGYRFFVPSYGFWKLIVYDKPSHRYATWEFLISEGATELGYGDEAARREFEFTVWQSGLINLQCAEGEEPTHPWLPEIGREGGLNAYTWAEIAQISEMGLADLYFSVGDTHSVTVNGTVGSTAINGNYYAYILGFNHDITDGEDRPSGITFGTFASGATISASTSTIALTSGSNGNTVTTAGNKYFSLNHEASSAKGGWAGCDARYDILGSTNVAPTNYASTSATVDRVGNNPTGRPSVSNTLLNAMTDVKAHTKPMITYSNADGGTTAASVQKSVDYLPLLSVAEVWGEGSETNPFINNKVKQYEFYANGNSKKKMRHSSSSTTAAWWLRDASSATSFRAISSNSSPTLTAMSGCTVSGIAPKFKI